MSFVKKHGRARRSDKRTACGTVPRLREFPESVKNRRPGEKLTNAQHIDLLQWLLDCLDDSARAAGLRAERSSYAG